MAEKLGKVVVAVDFQDIDRISKTDCERYEKLKVQIEEKARDALMGQEKVDAFNDGIDGLSKWLDGKLDDHNNLEPVAVEANIVKDQLAVHQVRNDFNYLRRQL